MYRKGEVMQVGELLGTLGTFFSVKLSMYIIIYYINNNFLCMWASCWGHSLRTNIMKNSVVVVIIKMI